MARSVSGNRESANGRGEGQQASQAKTEIVEELHRSARRNFSRRYVTIKGLDDLYQGDIVEMIPYSKQNKGNKYLLTIIDAFSKRGWAFPLKTKTGAELARVLNSFFNDLPQPPKLLQADNGSEFYNKDVTPVLKRYGVKLYSSFSPLKATIVERFNRTLKTWMWKEFSLQGTYNWIDILERLLDKYNHRVHRSIGLAPVAVNKQNEKRVLAKLTNKNLPPKKKNKFKVGDPVRISKFKHIFEKGYTPNWTTEVFTVYEVQKTRPVTYKLQDFRGEIIDGGFYEEELQKTKHKDIYLVEKVLKKKGNKVYIKWLGFDNTYNQWIDKADADV